MTDPTPARGRPFLTARWSNLFLATYVVPEELLTPRLPPGLELDRRDGHAFASLVAFDFLDTRVLGVPWPGYRDFPELNLRFYVRAGDRRGVVFVREFVPPRLVAFLARLLYNEPYRSAPISSRMVEAGDMLTAVYALTWQGKRHTLRATGAKPPARIDASGVEHFFKEHVWGFGRTRRGWTLCYEVSHPEWEVYPVREYAIDLDWAAVYGPEWGVMQGAEPYSTVLAVGSAVAVYPKGRLV